MTLLTLPWLAGRSIVTRRRRPYTGEELRAIRKKNGVGRPPTVRLAQEDRITAKWLVKAWRAKMLRKSRMYVDVHDWVEAGLT